MFRNKQSLVNGRRLNSAAQPSGVLSFTLAKAAVSEAWSSGHVPMKLRRLSSVTVAVGALLLSLAAVAVAESWFWQFTGKREFQDTQIVPPRIVTAALSKPRRGELIGKLQIPRLKMSVVVFEGSDDGVLKKGPGHIEETAYPGELGNVAIAGHRDTHFRPLRDIESGDEIILEAKATAKGNPPKLHYFVESTDIIDPTHMDILDPTPGPTLTLVTCFPFEFVGNAPMRFVIRATPRGGTGAASTYAKR